MMPGLQAENEELRRQLDQYRQRELSDLHQKLVVAVSEAQHYRAEAQRNADVGRQIAAEAEKTIAELRAKLSVYESRDASARRGISR